MCFYVFWELVPETFWIIHILIWNNLLTVVKLFPTVALFFCLALHGGKSPDRKLSPQLQSGFFLTSIYPGGSPKVFLSAPKNESMERTGRRCCNNFPIKAVVIFTLAVLKQWCERAQSTEPLLPVAQWLLVPGTVEQCCFSAVNILSRWQMETWDRGRTGLCSVSDHNLHYRHIHVIQGSVL